MPAKAHCSTACSVKNARWSVKLQVRRATLDAQINYNGRPYVLVDTAGIRRKSRIDEQPNRRVLRAIRVMDDADVVVVVLDALGGVTDQDARIINLAVDRYKPVLPSSTSGTSYPRIGKHKQYTENIHRILAT